MKELIYEAIPKVIEEIGPVGKNGVNKQQNYKFRSIDDIYNAISPAFAKHGVFAVPTILERTEEKNGKATRVILNVEWTFSAKDGSCVKATSYGEAIDYSDKATNKALTQSFKYTVIAVFAIALEGNQADGDLESPNIDHKMSKPAAKKEKKTITEIKGDKNTLDVILQGGMYKGKTIREVPYKDLKEKLELAFKFHEKQGENAPEWVKEAYEINEARGEK